MLKRSMASLGELPLVPAPQERDTGSVEPVGYLSTEGGEESIEGHSRGKRHIRPRRLNATSALRTAAQTHGRRARRRVRTQVRGDSPIAAPGQRSGRPPQRTWDSAHTDTAR